MIGMIGSMEVLVILLVILVLFGGKRLPEFARNLGEGIREFKRAAQDISSEIHTQEPILKEAPVKKEPTASDK